MPDGADKRGRVGILPGLATSRQACQPSQACLAVLFAIFAFFAAAAPGAAQETRDPMEGARFRFGPLGLTPSIAVTSLGTDDNVFNDSENPKRDTTAAIGPAVNLWLNLGRSRLTGKTSGQYLYFKEYTNQRAWNTSNEGRWEVPLGRLTPFLLGSYANTRDRPGYEIDSRARQRSDSSGLGTELRMSGKTTVVATARRSHIEFDQQETFLGTELAKALNRESNSVELQIRYTLTPLTTFVMKAEGVQDRFTLDSTRNADSLSVMPGFELKPSALISGSAFVGFRRFNALQSRVPDFQGITAAVDVHYIVSATRFDVKTSRNLAYSFEPLEPYYALTDLGLTVTERVTSSWDLLGRFGWQSLGYREIQAVDATLSANALVSSDARIDRGHQYGGGIGYRLGQTVRLGVEANYYQRESKVSALRTYQGLRIGASVSYGLPQ